ncbi:MAG: hypothetical protein OXG35_06130 [Acidobacteria bacterium]|nr:hypothetical protein [Acidobacteriota bacterium]
MNDTTRRELAVLAAGVSLLLTGGMLELLGYAAGRAAVVSAVSTTSLYCVAAMTNEQRAHFPESRMARTGALAWIWIAATAATACANIGLSAGSGRLGAALAGASVLTTVLTEVLAGRHPDPEIDKGLQPGRKMRHTAADNPEQAARLLLQGLVNDQVRQRGAVQFLDDLPTVVTRTGQVWDTPPYGRTPAEELGPFELERAGRHDVAATGPDGARLTLRTRPVGPENIEPWVMGRAEMGDAVHYYKVPAKTRTIEIPFRRIGWGPWRRNVRLPDGEAPDPASRRTSTLRLKQNELAV